MKILNQKTFTAILSLAIFTVPVLALAQIGIPCGDLTAGQKECGFDDLIILANNIIKFLMFSVAVPLAAIGFMWVGGKMVLYPDKESAKTEGKKSLEFIAIGFGIMLGAYVFIKTILFAFLTTEQASFMQFMFQ